ncbi:MAG: amidohydrolase family protein [Phycisphaerae bacterium]|jgi:predicted TIM-barrel fold metal-dependent hydrolase|nr:amidohydrolase family protein [Phycisphaerae bacterium]
MNEPGEHINVHCHLLNFDFVPDAFFKTRAPVREWMMRSDWFKWAAGLVSAIPWVKQKRLGEIVELMNQHIDQVADTLIEEMDDSGISTSIPLMMDLEIASSKQKPECPYRYQVQLISDIAAKHPGRLMPFIMFDPRRPDAADLVIRAVESMGFLGIKMYPALGYHPDPDSVYNESRTNTALRKVYEHCIERKIPITTHCSRGGAYGSDMTRYKDVATWLSSPAGWKGVLEAFGELFISFAHFGGARDLAKLNGIEGDWSDAIIDLMGRGEFPNVYADIAYHDKALLDDTSEQYFRRLEGLLGDVENINVADRILFGTDWPMTRHTWTESEYTEPFRDRLGKAFDTIAIQNPRSFLFPDKKLPDRIQAFFKARGIGRERLPQWMQNMWN